MNEPLSEEQRRDWERVLSEYMEMISERSSAASWKTGLTEILIAACNQVQRTGEPAIVENCYVSPAECEVLLFMVSNLGYWMDLDGPYQLTAS